MRVSYNWLKDYVHIRMPVEELADRLTMAGLEVTSAAKIDQDTVLEIEVTPNRADCLSMIGIAREVAAVLDKQLKVPRVLSFRGKAEASIPIQIKEKKLCLRYLGRVIRNIKVGPSPAWLAQRLEVMGIRPVNNIVDITNYCLLEFGQPLHAFDLDTLQGERLVIRRAQQGEQIVTIDGVKRQLDPSILVIADRFNPQAIAGIMGSKDSEVSAVTTNILLESAYFEPLNIHTSSRKLGLATQSSYRFERGVDLAGVYQGSLRATELLAELARPEKKKYRGIVIGRLIDKGTKSRVAVKVRLRYAKVCALLGTDIHLAQIRQIVRRLGFPIVRSSREGLTVEVPSFRADIYREVDLIEEIARSYGYHKIPLSMDKLTPRIQEEEKRQLSCEEAYHKIRQVLSSLGLQEIMTYSLISRQALRRLEAHLENIISVLNPLSYGQEIMRPRLVVGMLNTIVANLNRKNTDLRLFELGRIYRKENAKIAKELASLCIGTAGVKSGNWMQKSANYTFYDLKGIVQTLLQELGVSRPVFAEAGAEDGGAIFTTGRLAKVWVADQCLGLVGEIKKEVLEKCDIACSVYVCELELEQLLKHMHLQKRYRSLAKFPVVTRDISLFAPQDVQSQQITDLIHRLGRELVTKVVLFDQYSGEQIPEGSRGLAYSIEYRSKERTLTAEEVDKLHSQIRQALVQELKVQVR